METIKLWARNGAAVRQAIELGALVHLDTASEELTEAFRLFAMQSRRRAKWAEALRLIASNSTAPSALSSLFAKRSMKSSTTGLCTEGGVPDGRLLNRPSCQYNSSEVSVVCMQSAINVRSDQ